MLNLLIALSFMANGLLKSLPLPLATADPNCLCPEFMMRNIGTVPMTLNAIPIVPLQLAPLP